MCTNNFKIPAIRGEKWRSHVMVPTRLRESMAPNTVGENYDRWISQNEHKYAHTIVTYKTGTWELLPIGMLAKVYAHDEILIKLHEHIRLQIRRGVMLIYNPIISTYIQYRRCYVHCTTGRIFELGEREIRSIFAQTNLLVPRDKDTVWNVIF